MTLPASGAISTAQIRAEIGGSGPVTFPSSETNTLCGGTSTTLPTNYHGKSGGGGGSDQTPAAVNWANISGSVFASNASQTISGINVPIVLRATISGAVGAGSPRVLSNSLNSNTCDLDNGAFFDVTITNGQSIAFSALADGARSCTVTITNQSDAGAVLDTFTVSMS